MTSKVVYKGNLRTECEHLKSGNSFITDAPTDNNGKGEAFSPTDTVATALASCMLTIIGIKAENSDFSIENTVAEVTKTMASEPRRISKIEISFSFPKVYTDKQKKIIEHAAKTCPVWYSLHPDIEKIITFNYKDA
ncbi:OsmC family protein [Mesonia sp.]|uniref:OsmC family protein n=1 Tax=Mesonia sp. TaxID=1960830 RepID=UPI00175AFC13|nr:OsmC family protein [Mesonia sp.]HIB37463.1 OsmC family peroxiredoxin [Mesonia sp.]HIO26066.1 OsmC family peroxiredoxin [Flavobacteriaceae bacterium]